MAQHTGDDRRRFLGRLGGVAALGLAVGCAKQPEDVVAPPVEQLGDPAVGGGPGPVDTAAVPAPPPAPSGPVEAGPLEQLADGKGKALELGGKPVVVVREGDQVKAYSAVCTHKQCTLTWSDDDKQFICPCHKSNFDAAGQPTKGPATKPLATVPVKIEGGQILVG